MNKKEISTSYQPSSVEKNGIKYGKMLIVFSKGDKESFTIMIPPQMLLGFCI